MQGATSHRKKLKHIDTSILDAMNNPFTTHSPKKLQIPIGSFDLNQKILKLKVN